MPDSSVQALKLQRETDFLKYRYQKNCLIKANNNCIKIVKRCVSCFARRPNDPQARCCTECGSNLPQIPQTKLIPPQSGQVSEKKYAKKVKNNKSND